VIVAMYKARLLLADLVASLDAGLVSEIFASIAEKDSPAVRQPSLPRPVLGNLATCQACSSVSGARPRAGR
jgi:hypothetical protein